MQVKTLNSLFACVVGAWLMLGCGGAEYGADEAPSSVLASGVLPKEELIVLERRPERGSMPVSPSGSKSPGASTGAQTAGPRGACFGAVGIACTGEGFDHINPPLLQVGCDGNGCWINAGSWEHDQCCFENPTGVMCFGQGPQSPLCQREWDKAVSRVILGRGWRRWVDQSARASATGKVAFVSYCAPGGTRLNREDGRYCCGTSVPVSGDPTLAECRGSQRSCSSDEDCPETTLCGPARTCLPDTRSQPKRKLPPRVCGDEDCPCEDDRDCPEVHMCLPKSAAKKFCVAY